MPASTTGGHLRAIREKLGVSQVELSKAMGTSPNAISHLEARGLTTERTATSYALAAITVAKARIDEKQELQDTIKVLAAKLRRL